MARYTVVHSRVTVPAALGRPPIRVISVVFDDPRYKGKAFVIPLHKYGHCRGIVILVCNSSTCVCVCVPCAAEGRVCEVYYCKSHVGRRRPHASLSPSTSSSGHAINHRHQRHRLRSHCCGWLIFNGISEQIRLFQTAHRGHVALTRNYLLTHAELHYSAERACHSPKNAHSPALWALGE